jgi:hypothetical protein
MDVHCRVAAILTKKGDGIRTITSRVTVLPSVTMNPVTRFAVAEVSQNAQGVSVLRCTIKIGAIDKLAQGDFVSVAEDDYSGAGL